MSERLFLQSEFKLLRAGHHLAELDRATQAFLETKPYVFGVHHDPQARKKQVYIEQIHRLPIDLPLITADAVHNLRVALDLLVADLVRFSGARVTTTHQFPIGRDAKHWAEECRKRLKGIAAKIATMIEQMNVYPGANDALVVLHDLNRMDKHQSMILVGTMVEAPLIEIGTNRIQGLRVIGIQKKHGLAAASDSYEVKVHPHAYDTLSVTFAPDHPWTGEPALHRLQSVRDGIAQLLSAFRNACAAFG